jgi:hypothetical protein
MVRGLLLLLSLGAVCAQLTTLDGPPTKSLTLDFACKTPNVASIFSGPTHLHPAATLEGIGCNCAQSPTQAEILAKCATCACSSYGCCRPPDCASPACG